MAVYYTDKISVKPYVAEFLKKHLGEPMLLKRGNIIYFVFMALCVKKLKRYDLRISLVEKGFLKNQQLVDIQFTITRDFMEHYGYQLTDTCHVIFRNFLEEYAKTYINAGYLATKEMDDTVMLKDQVDIIRQLTGITEDTYSRDSIEKHIYRNFRKPQTQPNQLALFK